MDNYRLCGGKLILGDSTAEKDLLLKNGKIEAIINRKTPTPDYHMLDCAGMNISPGFVEIHSHGGGGSDYMDDDDDAYKNSLNMHVLHGTTSLLPTTLSAGTEGTLKAIKRYLNAKADKSLPIDLLGLHMEGPFLSPAQAGAQRPENIREFNAPEYQMLYDASEGNIRRWSVAPEKEGAKEFADFALKNDITLSIAHSNADFDTVVKAFDWGYRHVTHLYSGMSTVYRENGFRIAGVVEAAYYLDGMNVEIIADGCHLPDSLLKLCYKAKGADRIALITDSMRAAGQESGESFLGSKKEPMPVIIEDGVAKLLSRDAFGGSIATSDRLIRTMLKAGISLTEAVKMATSSPIKMMGLKHKKGEIKEGFDADICVFDDNVNVKHVFVGGIKRV